MGTGVHDCCSRPRAAHAVLSCAGAYVSGATGSNECPAGSVRIETEAACRTAAAAVGKTAGDSSNPFVASYSFVPRGCFFNTNTLGTSVLFNPDAVGAGRSAMQLLCAAVTTGAPPPHRCTCACAPACGALRVCNIVRVLLGTYMVLKGTPTVLRTRPSTRNSYGFLWQ